VLLPLPSLLRGTGHGGPRPVAEEGSSSPTPHHLPDGRPAELTRAAAAADLRRRRMEAGAPQPARGARSSPARTTARGGSPAGAWRQELPFP
jgi:hypothetical protein